ncbi:MAG TPA: hypothetical protein VNR70_14050 [Steroidobacteraceae bacterium]|nr:hypothetical protein [Steroidobacteraceae bacterium]
MSGKPKAPVFPKDEEGVRRTIVNWAQTTPADKLVEAGNVMQRGTKMKRPSGHTPAVQAVHDVVAANRDMLPAELWDKFGHEPRFIGLAESKFKRRAIEARTEIRKSVKPEK